ncbi:MAG: hypothetical protein C4K60_04065 [Ideonella sp. MAG2]|nr:MAG: hypothetical protein C4K60_04065 [Ideonella sp. MAG2]
MDAWLQPLLETLALPSVGLPAVFVISLLSATLLPLGSEPAVMALVSLDPSLFWPTMVVATAGNTLGGVLSWWMGRGAEHVYERAYEKVRHRSPHELRALTWLKRFGPKACLLSWLPLVGDPLCALAGWLRLDFWPCVLYMAIGKFIRFVVYTALLLWWFPGLSGAML